MFGNETMKTLTKIFAFAALATTAVTNTQAAEWSELNTVGNEYRLFYDATSLHTVKKSIFNKYFNQQYQQAWFKQEVQNDINLTDNLGVGDYVLNLWRFDCTTHKIGLVKSMYYKQTGQFLSQTATPYVLMSNLVPDTAGELMWKQVCLSPSTPLQTPNTTVERGSENTDAAPGTGVAIEQ